MPSAVDVRRWGQALAWFLLGALLFTLAYCQAPLYYSNQNQYFLHGLARAGVGLLGEDWLAQTLDPTPVFTALVAFTTRYLHPSLFYVYYGILFGVYLAALLALFRLVAGPERQSRWPLFVALLIVLHSGVVRWGSYQLCGQDYPWYLQSGVANQYILGGLFQPSCFGVLLVAAISLFACDRPVLAVVLVALAATLHTTYLLSAGLITLGFLTSLLIRGKPRQAGGLGLLALLLVLPVTLHVLWTFGPTTEGRYEQAQDILVNFRIPHHARIDRWLDVVAGLQIAWIALALFFVRRGPLFYVLLVPFVLSVLLSYLQWASGDLMLALLFPWRISSVLVPIATAILLSRLLAGPSLPLEGAPARLAASGLIAAVVAAGVWIMATGQAFLSSDEEERGLLQHVREHCQPGDVYLVPVYMPDPARAARGAASAEFKTQEARRRDAQLNPLEIDRFRLASGAPIFVDFKSIPYKDVEVIEWRRRHALAWDLQKQLQAGHTKQVVPQLRSEGITHVVVPAGPPLESRALEKQYEDAHYRLYRLRLSAGD